MCLHTPALLFFLHCICLGVFLGDRFVDFALAEAAARVGTRGARFLLLQHALHACLRVKNARALQRAAAATPQRALAKQKVAAAKAIGAAAGAGAAMGAAMGRRHSSWGVVKMAEGFEVANT